MKLIDFIKHLGDTLNPAVQKELLKKADNSLVPNKIKTFILSLCDPQNDLNSLTLNNFLKNIRFKKLSPSLRKLIGYVFIEYGIRLINETKEEIATLRKELKESIDSGYYTINGFKHTLIQKQQAYKKLVVIHQLYRYFAIDPLKSVIDINQYQDPLFYQIPYALNVLQLTGKFVEIDVRPFIISPPFQETTRIPAESKNLPAGTKDSSRFYKIERVAKLNGSSVMNGVALAYDPVKNKQLYLRVKPTKYFDFSMVSNSEKIKIEVRDRKGVFASKIARRISKKHFSSERLVNNLDIASKALPGYKTSIVVKDAKGQISVANGILSSILPGLGIIDETCNFIEESDRNLENIGISKPLTEKLDDAHYTKIDFGECFSSRKKAVEYKADIYPKDNVYDETHYHCERLKTKIKLSLFTRSLLEVDANKCFHNKVELDQVLDYCDTKNSELTKELEDKNVIKNILEQKISISEIYNDVILFLIEHDNKNLSYRSGCNIIDEVMEKAVSIGKKINNEEENKIKELRDELKTKLLQIKQPQLVNDLMVLHLQTALCDVKPDDTISKDIEVNTKILKETIPKIIKQKISLSQIHYQIMNDFIKNKSQLYSFAQGKNALAKASNQALATLELIHDKNTKAFKNQKSLITYNHHTFLTQLKKSKQTFYQRNKQDITFGARMMSGTGALLTVGLAIAINAIPVIGQMISLGMFIGIAVGMIAGGGVIGAAFTAGICKMDEANSLTPVSPVKKATKDKDGKYKITPIQSRLPKSVSQNNIVTPASVISTIPIKGLLHSLSDTEVSVQRRQPELSINNKKTAISRSFH